MDKALAWLLAFVLVIAGSYFAGGFILMLLVGILHHWDKNIPPMGFWLSCLVALLVRACVWGTTTATVKDK